MSTPNRSSNRSRRVVTDEAPDASLTERAEQLLVYKPYVSPEDGQEARQVIEHSQAVLEGVVRMRRRLGDSSQGRDFRQYHPQEAEMVERAEGAGRLLPRQDVQELVANPFWRDFGERSRGGDEQAQGLGSDPKAKVGGKPNRAQRADWIVVDGLVGAGPDDLRPCVLEAAAGIDKAFRIVQAQGQRVHREIP